jgi:CRP-like cAMP-binding protein
MGGGNRLLAALPPADLALLSPHLQKVSLEQDAVVVRSGDRREHVYFPHSGAISFMLDMPNGATIATAVIGREGALGALSVLGPSRSSVTAVVRVGGTASQISVSRFHAAYMGSSAIRDVVQAHTGWILSQLQHVAACNGLHPVEARLARWLLELHDRTEGPIMSSHAGDAFAVAWSATNDRDTDGCQTPCRWCYQIRSAGLDRN